MAVGTAMDAKVDTLRAQLPAVHTTGYFNSGSNGPIPITAFTAADADARRELEQGRIVPGAYIENRERNRRLAAMAASIFGADADEIALAHSATEGLGTALMGMTWSPGDEVITTVEEHPGLILPLALLARRFGVLTRYADIVYGASGVVEALAGRITSRTRGIARSHVLWSTAALLQLRKISELARGHGMM